MTTSRAKTAQRGSVTPHRAPLHNWGRDKGSSGQTFKLRPPFQVNPKNDLGHQNLSLALDDGGDLEGPIGECREAVRLNPGDEKGHVNLSSAFYKKGNVDAGL
jgi:hypothetical protein